MQVVSLIVILVSSFVTGEYIVHMCVCCSDCCTFYDARTQRARCDEQIEPLY